MKYLIILIILVGGGYYYKQNINDCETEYDVQEKSLEYVSRLNELARKNNISTRVTYYQVQQKLEEIKKAQGGTLSPKIACYSLDVVMETMEKTFNSTSISRR